MKELKKFQKQHFLTYFPYGLCSRQATTITGRGNQSCSDILLGAHREKIVKQCKAYKDLTNERAKYTCAQGLARDTTYKCGEPATPHSFRALTKKGLQAVIEAPDEAISTMENAEDIPEIDMDNNGEIKGKTLGKISRQTESLRDELHAYATSTDPEDQATFQRLLLEAVISGQVTPLTASLAILPYTKITTPKYSSFQYYNIWRYSHINAMFRANDHLTWLDRRPYDTGYATDGIHDEESYQAYIQKHGCTMAALTYRALTDWYSSNPNYYRITQQYPDDSDEAYDEWLNTPAFYNARELPNLNDKEKGNYDEGLTGSQKKLNATIIGLATGRKINFACYHAKPGAFNWILLREKRTKAEADAIVREMKTQCPQMRCANTVEYALYFCTSHHQFLALFDRTKKNFKKGQTTKHLMKDPYASVHAIPVNDGGTVLLWCLLEEGPMSIQHSICNNLVDMNIGFKTRVDPVFPLTFRGKKVFAGYTMNITAIHTALECYLEGQQFYLCCFAEQAKWYSMLFPDITIL